MENYKKGQVTEEPLSRDNIPIPNLPDNFLWMQVRSGSKMHRLLDHASGILDAKETKAVVWTGSGDGALRAISCAEAMKRYKKIEHQITRIGYRKCEEIWEPQIDGLERLVVSREIPIIHILLSFDLLDSSELGYQSINSKNSFWQTNTKKKPNKRPKIPPEEIAAMGLQTNSTKNKKSSSQYNSKKKTQSEKN